MKGVHKATLPGYRLGEADRWDTQQLSAGRVRFIVFFKITI